MSVLRGRGGPGRARRDRPVGRPCEIFERREPRPYRGLPLTGQLARPRGILLLDQPEARLVAGELLERNLRRTAIEDERALAARGASRVETIERPVARVDRELLLVEPVHEVVAVRDARAVGDDQ